MTPEIAETTGKILDAGIIFMSPERTAEVLGISRASVYDLLREGKLMGAKHGKRRLIAAASVREWANHKLATAGVGS